jgi:hypothetical protein
MTSAANTGACCDRRMPCADKITTSVRILRKRGGSRSRHRCVERWVRYSAASALSACVYVRGRGRARARRVDEGRERAGGDVDCGEGGRAGGGVGGQGRARRTRHWVKLRPILERRKGHVTFGNILSPLSKRGTPHQVRALCPLHLLPPPRQRAVCGRPPSLLSPDPPARHQPRAPSTAPVLLGPIAQRRRSVRGRTYCVAEGIRGGCGQGAPRDGRPTPTSAQLPPSRLHLPPNHHHHHHPHHPPDPKRDAADDDEQGEEGTATEEPTQRR